MAERIDDDISREEEPFSLEDFAFEGIDDVDPWSILKDSGLEVADTDSLINDVEETDESFSPNPYDINDKFGSVSIGASKDLADLFDDELQLQLATLIRVRVRDICNRTSSDSRRVRAIQWVFVSEREDMEENDFLSFRDVLSVFGARVEVFQARIVYEMYLRSVPMRSPLPYDADPPPGTITGELHSSFKGVDAINAEAVFRSVWFWPGIRVDILSDVMLDSWLGGGNDLSVIMEALMEGGYVGVRHGLAYAICRNPMMLASRKRGFEWSTAL